MKLVIELDDETYNDTIDRPRLNLIGLFRLIEAVQKGTPLEEELEKIKEEMDKLHKINCDFECIRYYNDLEIIDRHIKELKGE